MVTSNVNILLYAYLLACILLIIFNIFYIFYADLSRKKVNANTKKWKKEISEELEFIEEKGVSDRHIFYVQKNVSKTNELLAYFIALEELSKENNKEKLDIYYKNFSDIYADLAFYFINKDPMDKAFMAYFISKTFKAFEDDNYGKIYVILKEYISNSTVFCRENILKALYAFGDATKVYDFLAIMEDNEMYHHKKLLSDGLTTFAGDKSELAEILWNNRKRFKENTRISIIAFINTLDDDYKTQFLYAMQRKNVSVEEKIAYLRYFKNHKYELAGDVILSYLKENIDTNLSIVAATVLSSYPSTNTIKVLKQSLTSPNWYIRLNAANSLIDIKIPDEDIDEILNGNDKYARDILIYVLEERGITKYA